MSLIQRTKGQANTAFRPSVIESLSTQIIYLLSVSSLVSTQTKAALSLIPYRAFCLLPFDSLLCFTFISFIP